MNYYINTGYGGTPAWKKLSAGIEGAVLKRKSILLRDTYLNGAETFTEKIRMESCLTVVGCECGDEAVSYLINKGGHIGEEAESELIYFSDNGEEAKKVKVSVGIESLERNAEETRFSIALYFDGNEADTVFTAGEGVNGSEQQLA